MEVVLAGNSGKRKLLKPILKDILTVENLNVRKVKKNAAIDFKNNIVIKPWGFEYLCGRNKNIEAWELYIDPQAATSLHCHPNKDTLNIILEGRVSLETVRKREMLRPGDFRLLKAGTIHRTSNVSARFKARVLEIESPSNKYDLLRIKDNYGRESLGYVKFRMQKIAERPFQKCLCLLRNHHPDNGKEFYILHEFIPSRVRKSTRSIAVYELFVRAISFQCSQHKILKGLRLTAAKNLIVTEGSLSLRKKNKILKLLPGNCIFDVSLEKFNWSAKTAKMLVW